MARGFSRHVWALLSTLVLAARVICICGNALAEQPNRGPAAHDCCGEAGHGDADAKHDAGCAHCGLGVTAPAEKFSAGASDSLLVFAHQPRFSLAVWARLHGRHRASPPPFARGVAPPRSALSTSTTVLLV